MKDLWHQHYEAVSRHCCSCTRDRLSALKYLRIEDQPRIETRASWFINVGTHRPRRCRYIDTALLNNHSVSLLKPNREMMLSQMGLFNSTPLPLACSPVPKPRQPGAKKPALGGLLNVLSDRLLVQRRNRHNPSFL